MGFWSKLGSFAAPAGLFAAGTIASGGNPLAGMGLVGTLGAGAGGLARNEEEERIRKMMEQQSKNQGVANLVNLLSPRANYQARPAPIPKRSFLGSIARAADQGVHTFQTGQRLAQLAETRDLQNQVARARLQQIQQAGARQVGADASLAGGLEVFSSENRGGGPGPETSRRVNPSKFQNLFGQSPPPEVLGGFREHEAATADTTRRADLDERRLRVAEGSLDLQERNATHAATGVQRQAQERVLGFAEQGVKAYLLRNPALTFEEFLSEPGAQSITSQLGEEELSRLQTSFVSRQQELFESLQDGTNKVLFQQLAPRINQDDLLSNVGNLQFGLGTVVSGASQNNGFGDIAMIVGAVRLKDPGVSVRAEDIKTEEKALTYLHDVGLFVSGERIFGDGGRLLPGARSTLLEASEDLYKTHAQQVDLKLETFLPTGLDALPINAIDGESRVVDFLETYRLPPISTYALPGVQEQEGRGTADDSASELDRAISNGLRALDPPAFRGKFGQPRRSFLSGIGRFNPSL